MQPREPSYAATVVHRLTTLHAHPLRRVRRDHRHPGGARPGARDVVVEADRTARRRPASQGRVCRPATSARTSRSQTRRAASSRLVVAAIQLAGLALWIGVLWLLRGITRTVIGGDPFTSANVRRLQAIGVSADRRRHSPSTSPQGALEGALLEPYLRPAADLDAAGLRPPDRDFPADPAGVRPRPAGPRAGVRPRHRGCATTSPRRSDGRAARTRRGPHRGPPRPPPRAAAA